MEAWSRPKSTRVARGSLRDGVTITDSGRISAAGDLLGRKAHSFPCASPTSEYSPGASSPVLIRGSSIVLRHSLNMDLPQPIDAWHISPLPSILLRPVLQYACGVSI